MRTEQDYEDFISAVMVAAAVILAVTVLIFM